MSTFLGPYTIGLLNFRNENFAVPHISGIGGFQDGADGSFQKIVGHYNGEIPALYVRCAIGNPAVYMPPFFISYPGNVPVTKEVDLNLMERFFDLIKFRFSNNCFNFLHNRIIFIVQKYIKTKYTPIFLGV